MNTLVIRQLSIQFLGEQTFLTPGQGQNDFIIYCMPHKFAWTLQEMWKKLRLGTDVKELIIYVGKLK